ncbi:MAG: YaiI/YqxD family protein [Parvularculaceae bacterium]|nr:YaiI/YqxD family protein [Parvularculaceae bacterium]
MTEILVDADACPVKDEIYRVAERYGLNVKLVANAFMRIPREPWVALEVVSDHFDAADDRIVELVTAQSIVITADILLADRCLKAEAGAVLAPNGKPFTADTIGGAIATRAIMADLRGSGDQVGGGPPPFQKKDRSRFLSELDRAVNRLKR